MYEIFFIIGAIITFVLPNFKLKSYLADWLHFVIFLLLYEFMRGEIGELATRVHIQDLINIERSLFGTIPTLTLQRMWHTPGSIAWYEILFYNFYLAHFLFPFFTAYWLWLMNRTVFRAYRTGFLAMTFMGLALYYLYPAMPPWLASRQGYLPEIHRLILDIPLTIGLPLRSVTLTFNLIGANPVAAMPSLHAAWPTFVSGFLILWYRRRLWPLLIIPVGIWLSIVYLGEHYVIDVIAGIAVALFGLIVSRVVIRRGQTTTR